MYVAPALGAFQVHVGMWKGCSSRLVNQGVVWFSQISVQKQPFSNSALLHLQLLGFGGKLLLSCYHSCGIFLLHKRKFCSSATTRAECFSSDKSSAVLLPCYHSCRMFLTRSIFCCPATTRTECFLPEKCSAVLVPQ